MKKMIKLISTFVVVAVLLAACNSGGGQAPANSSGDTGAEAGKKLLLNIAATPTSTPHYAYYTAVSQAINKSAGDKVETTVVESGGTKVNATNLQQKKIDVAFVASDIAYESYTGTGQFEGQQNEDIRLLWNLTPTMMHWAVTKESGIETFEELNGQPFNPSTIGGGGEFVTFKVFEELGIEPDFKRMQIGEAADQVINGQLVGFSYNGNVPIAKFTEVNAQKPLRILSLSDEQAEQVIQKYPYFVKQTIPAESYSGIEEAQTLGIYVGTAVNSSLPEDVAYEMVKAYWENLSDVEAAFPAINGTRMEDTVEHSPVPLHKGAIKYYEEQGLTIPDELKVD